MQTILLPPPQVFQLDSCIAPDLPSRFEFRKARDLGL